jgi:NADPH:quinone reductase-like Zn-dependent oxidoreductase
MRAVTVSDGTGFDGIELVEQPVPEPGPRDVLIRVRSASLNFRDLLIPLGAFPGAVPAPGRVPLSDGAGDVVATGREVTRARVGDRVAVTTKIGWVGGPPPVGDRDISPGFTIDGLLREYAAFHEEGIVRIPDEISYDEAAALPCAAVSAWAALTTGPPSLLPSDTLLVQGTGGVSMFALQFGLLCGARVIGITSSGPKSALMRKLGAAAVVNYREIPEWQDKVLELTGGRGVDRVVDIGGGDTVDRSARCTRVGGVVSCVGFVTGQAGGINPITLVSRALQVRGHLMGNRGQFEEMLTAMTSHGVRPVIDSTVFRLHEAALAYKHLHEARHIGKVVVQIGLWRRESSHDQMTERNGKWLT